MARLFGRMPIGKQPNCGSVARGLSDAVYPSLRQNLLGSWCPALGFTGTGFLHNSVQNLDMALNNVDPPDWGVDQYGKYLNLMSIGSASYANATFDVSNWKGFSVFVKARLYQTNTSVRFLFDLQYSGNDGFRIFKSNGTILVADDDGSFTNYSGTWSESDRDAKTIAVSHDEDAGTKQVVYNGDHVGVDVASSFDFSTASGLANINSRNNGSSKGHFYYYFVYMWNRALTVNELQLVHHDNFAPVRRREMFYPVQASSGSTILPQYIQAFMRLNA